MLRHLHRLNAAHDGVLLVNVGRAGGRLRWTVTLGAGAGRDDVIDLLTSNLSPPLKTTGLRPRPSAMLITLPTSSYPSV